jgi:hypothetical protein
MAVYKITLSASSWTLATAALWYNTSTPGKFYSDSGATTEAASVQIPTRELYRFNGFYSSTSGGTQYIDADGNFTAALLSLSITSARTFYAQGTQVSYKITLSDNNGSGGDGALYYRISGGGVYADYLCEGSPAESVTKPSRTNYVFAGYHNGTSTPGTQYIDKDGRLTSDLSSITLTGAKTIYARWVAPYKVTVSANSGSGGTTAFWFDSVSGGFYSDNNLTDPITAIIPHTRECFSFVGCYSSNNTTSTLRVSEDGTIAADWVPTAAATVYAQWDRVSWPITLNKNSGSGGPDAIYGGVSGGFWADDLCTERIYSVEIPARDGYTFYGYWQTAGGSGNLYVKADGTINFSQSVITTGAYTIHAYWDANTYTLAFDPNGGTCDTASKTVKFASAVGVLPVPSHSKADFVAWRVNGQQISSSSPWTIASDATAIAEWDFYFGDLTDWFGLASSTLIPISSDAGDNRQRIVTRHYGRYKYGAYQGADATSGIWRNPTVRYMVVGDMTLSLFLGDAFAATTSGGGMTITGYMIASVSIDTRSGQFPIVTVQGTANEGADAINLFTVKVPILARARAQNLLGAISGGGDLQACSLVATCDPVVLAENMMPCASDVVGGRFELNAETLAPNREAAPTMAAASTSDNINYGGFTLIDSPAIGEGANYRRYSVTARKEIS